MAIATHESVAEVVGLKELWSKHTAAAVSLAPIRIDRDDMLDWY